MFLNSAGAEEVASDVEEALGRRLYLRGQDQLNYKVCERERLSTPLHSVTAIEASQGPYETLT